MAQLDRRWQATTVEKGLRYTELHSRREGATGLGVCIDTAAVGHVAGRIH